MQIVKLKTADLAPNTGQVPGLPTNPRQWTSGDIDKIAASLRETPELFEARPVLVIPHGGKYVILGGNLRYEGARKNKEKEVPAIIFPEDTPPEKLREIVVKDNGSFGAWDYDALANEWDDQPLTDWGVPAWNTDGPSPDEFGEDFKLPDGEKADARQMSFVLSYAQAALVDAAIGLSLATIGEVNEENENRNGVALFEIIKEWSRAAIGEVNEENARADLKKATEKTEEIRQYFCDALQKSGRKSKDVDDLLGTNGMAGHYFGASQWLLPTRSAYEKMQTILPLGRKYEELAAIVARQKYMVALVELRQFIGQK